MRFRASALGIAFSLIAAACTSGGSTSATHAASPAPTVRPSATATPSPAPQMVIPTSLNRFGTLANVPLLVEGKYPGPATPHSLTGVDASDEIAEQILSDPSIRSALEHRGFVIVPTGTGGYSDYRQFWSVYASMDYDASTIYVTTDAGYHHWHLVFDKVLRSLEQDVFLPKLGDLVAGMVANTQTQATRLRGTDVAQGAQRAAEVLQVTASLLGVPAGTLSATAQKELALIREHAQMTRSPLLGVQVDYSLFTPRGHYTRTPELTRYFLGMSVLGQLPFAVNPKRPQELLPAVFMARALLPQGIGSTALLRLWRDLYEPTAFLIGAADDYTPVELAAALEAVRPGAMTHPRTLTPTVLRAAERTLLAERHVMVDPESPSVRIMGTRFVLDSWILDQLLAPNVGKPGAWRTVASSMDVASAFRSPLAQRVERETGQFRFANFGKQLHLMREAVANRDRRAWSSTVYDAWLWALEPMWRPHGDAFPDYMRTRAWTAKDHQTGSGSYTELKHDTLLYTKQAAGEGAGPMPKYERRNWVEPDPVAFGRLEAAANLMRTGLDRRGLLTDEADGLLKTIAKLEGFLARIAADELQGKPISSTDNQRLQYIGGEFESLWWRTSDKGTGYSGTLDDNSAVIADIARAQDQVVEDGTGRVERILVIVPDDQGGFQVAIGAVYSFYEFLQPLSQRLDDETWRQMLDDGTAPDRPAWEDAFLPG